MLKIEEVGQILYSNLSIAEKDALLQQLLVEREAAIGVAATFYAAMTLAILGGQASNPSEVEALTKEFIIAANDNEGLIASCKKMAIGFVEARLKGFK